MSPTIWLEDHPLHLKLHKENTDQKRFEHFFSEREFAILMSMKFSDRDFKNMVTVLWPHIS